MSETETPEAPPPTPADVAERRPQSDPSLDEDTDDDGQDNSEHKTLTPEERVRRARSQSHRLRERLKEAEKRLQETEPLAKKALEAEEANKSEVQRAIERAEAAEKRETEKDLALYRRDLADEHKIPRDKLHLLGSGSREEMEAIAAEIGPLFTTSEKTPPPPSDRPVEGLRPGASPDSPKPADDSYPAAWKPPHLREKNRSQYGQ